MIPTCPSCESDADVIAAGPDCGENSIDLTWICNRCRIYFDWPSTDILNVVCGRCGEPRCLNCGVCGALQVRVFTMVADGSRDSWFCTIECAWERRYELVDVDVLVNRGQCLADG